MLENTKVYVPNEHISKQVQRIAFEQGFSWEVNGVEVSYTDKDYLYFSDLRFITYSNNKGNFKAHSYKEINYKKILDMKTKMIKRILGFSKVSKRFMKLFPEAAKHDGGFNWDECSPLMDHESWYSVICDKKFHIFFERLPKELPIPTRKLNMTLKFLDKVVSETLTSVKDTLTKKGKEYDRNNNPLHSCEQGAKITGQTREQVLYGFALKHIISINDIREDIAKGKLPTEEMVEEKFNDLLAYTLLEKASILDRINKNK